MATLEDTLAVLESETKRFVAAYELRPNRQAFLCFAEAAAALKAADKCRKREAMQRYLDIATQQLNTAFEKLEA